MKKKVLIIVALLLILCGCKKDQKIDPFYLEDEYYNESKIIEITSDEFIKLQEDKKSFAISIYLKDCVSCAAFSQVLNTYLESHTITFYKMAIQEAQKTNIADKDKGYVKYAPAFIIFKEGEKVSFLDSVSDDDKDAFKNVDSFNTWFTKYVLYKNEEE